MRTHSVVGSPLGDLVVIADDGTVTGLYFADRHRGRPARAEFGDRDDNGFLAVRQQLREYFDGDRRDFELPLDARGDDFQRRVWQLVAAIPYGGTRSYGELADDLGDRSLAQQVGAAVGANPLCLLVACHRVVGADGRLTGYAGGLDRKRFLLELEEPAERRASRLF
ncbi:methylated-DNA--[protein]-cysteine S-methyltransferase [Actinacidiphila acidipaludis]|uniref:Methylated-DNA--protein-cysteine methyltransferase n=1 Tax=Actinacidiphila acidipaludis TaxID=2873382 RepID=A0ABS7Q3A7_9ACTN|nr:methylated-DNA--[protein]-cysteine S-methyltransferase [Streptomyces acidipaludis]MBY8877628.1 methylated-DNA--[protein]-cysteine S-methyltransferase [Streptomyces acidipaludis]